MDETTDSVEQSDWPEWKQQLAASLPYWTSVLLACAMVGTGCSVDIQDVKNNIKKPVFLIAGSVVRFVLMPLLSMGLGYAVGLSDPEAMGFVIEACSPGGSSANMFTSCIGGDVSLSKSTIVTDKIMALGFMPLNLFIFSLIFGSDSVEIPYVKIVITLIVMMVFVIIGLLIHWKLKTIAQIIVKIGAILAVCLMILYAICQAILYPEVFTEQWEVWVAAILYPLSGLILRVVLSLMCRCCARCCIDKGIKSAAMETGVENLCVTFTVISLSLTEESAAEASVIPILTALTLFITNSVVLVVYRVFLNRKGTQKGHDNQEVEKTKQKMPLQRLRNLNRKDPQEAKKTPDAVDKKESKISQT